MVEHGEQNCYICKTIFRLLLCTCNHGVQVCSLFGWCGLVGCDVAYDCMLLFVGKLLFIQH
jgi:hypothetical protein